MLEIKDFQSKVVTLLGDIAIKLDEPMSKHTSFRIGGAADVMVFPKTPEELAKVLKVSALLDCKTYILGAGTNILAPDEGLRGIVICLKDSLDGMKQLDENHIYVGGGVTMTRAAVFAAGLGLSGLEFAHGIPGTIGGGVYMNAGAYGGDISMVCQSVRVMFPDGKVVEYSAEQMQFSYRHSRLEEENAVVLSAVFRLIPKPETEIREVMQDLMNRRKTSQPLDKPSAGSAFKRPATGYAAALIDQTGLKGYRIGDAAVSEKHAGFVVNLGSATAKDVRSLLASVAEKVMDATGVQLEPEVRIW
jgi:UDP-N-acetylmuramate dehydrogenase